MPGRLFLLLVALWGAGLMPARTATPANPHAANAPTSTSAPNATNATNAPSATNATGTRWETDHSSQGAAERQGRDDTAERPESTSLRGASSAQHLWIVLPPRLDGSPGAEGKTSGGRQRGAGGWRLLHLHPSMSAGFRVAATLPTPPSALAAFGDRLWLVFPASPEHPGAGEVWTVKAVYNEVIEGWFSEPLDRLELRPGLPATGRLEAFAADAAGPLALLRTPDGGRALLRLRSDGWQVDEAPPPPPRGIAPVSLDVAGATRMTALGPEGATLVLVEGVPVESAPVERQGAQQVWTRPPREAWVTMEGTLPGQAMSLTSSAGLAVAGVLVGSDLELFALRGREPLRLGAVPLPEGAWCLLGVDAGLRLFSLSAEGGAMRLQAIDPRGPITPVDLPLSSRFDDRARWIHIPVLGFMAMGASMLLLLAFSERLGQVVPLGGAGVPAELPPRALATLIDYLPAAVVVGLVMSGPALDLLTLPIWTTPVERAAAPIAALLISALSAGVCEAIWGRSIGKRVTGLSVVRQDGSRAGAWRCLLRSLLKFLVLCMPLLGVFHLLNPQKRGLPDLLSATTVVREAPTAEAP